MGINYAPYSYSELNLVDGTYSPSEVHNVDDYTYWYWFRSLYQRAASTLDFQLPDEWTAEAKDFFVYCLMKYGKVAVFESAQFGLSFNPCTLFGFDLYYQPTDALITNPALNDSLELKLHKDCELIKLTPDYLGIFDIIDFYAQKIANASTSVDMTLENSKLAFIVAGKTKSAINTLKKVFDKISKGITSIVFDGRCVDSKADIEPITWLTRDVKSSYIGTDLIQDTQTILNMFDREIGIPTVPYQKKERMVEYESKSAMLDSSSRLATWLNSLESSIEAVNNMFGLSISVEARINEDDFEPAVEGGDSDE